MAYQVHHSAIVDEDAQIGDGSCAWHFVHVCAGNQVIIDGDGSALCEHTGARGVLQGNTLSKELAA